MSEPSHKCDLGNGEWDHDWQERHDSSGEVDGGPGDHWSWRECRACGATEETPNQPVQRREITCPHCQAKVVDSGKRDELTQDWIAECVCGWWRTLAIPHDPESNAPNE